LNLAEPLQQTSYTYDSLDRVTKITYADTSAISYGYDADGNRTSMADQTGTTTWTYDAQNRQTGKTSPRLATSPTAMISIAT
jgi:YD repeat-containing protein